MIRSEKESIKTKYRVIFLREPAFEVELLDKIVILKKLFAVYLKS